MRSFLQSVLQQLHRYNVLVNDYQQATQHAADHATAHMNWAIRSAQEGNMAEALERFGKAATMAPDNAAIFANWGIALVKQQRVTEGIAKFETALALEPGNPEWHSLLGAAQVEHNQLDAANTTYQQALANNPEHYTLYNSWGIALARRGDYDEAIQKFQASLTIRRYQPWLYFLWGVILAEKEAYEDAIDKFKQTLRFLPKHEDALYFWCVCLNRLGQHNEAVVIGRQCLAVMRDDAHQATTDKPQDTTGSPTHQDNPEIYLALGEALFALGQMDTAKANVRHALLLNPKLAEAHELLGQICAKDNDTEAACQHFKQALAFNPALTRIHAHWGQALLQAGQEADALAQLNIAQQAHPDNTELTLLWASLALKQGTMDDALGSLFSLAEQEDWNPKLHFLLGSHYLEEGDYAKAQQSLSQVLSHDPTHIDAAIQLALAYCGLHQTEDAVRTLRPLIREYPHNPRVLFYYAHMLYRHGDWPAAEDKYQAALNHDATMIEAALGLAESQLMQRRFAPCLQTLSTYFTTTTTSPTEPIQSHIPTLLTQWATIGWVFQQYATADDNPYEAWQHSLNQLTPPPENTVLDALYQIANNLAYQTPLPDIRPLPNWQAEWAWVIAQLAQRGILPASSSLAATPITDAPSPYDNPLLVAVIASD